MRFLYKISSFQDFEKAALCQYLEDMAKKGWRLHSIGYFLLFVKSEPVNMKFSIDYKTFETKTLIFRMKDENVQDYLQLCEDSGWQFVCLWKNAFVFHSEADKQPEPLCSDIRLDFQLYVKRTIVTYVLSFILLAEWYRISLPLRYQMSFQSVMGVDIIISLFMSVFFTILWLCASLRYFYHIGKYQYAIWKQQELPPIKTSYHTWYHRLYPCCFWLLVFFIGFLCLFNITTLPHMYAYPYNRYICFGWILFILILGVLGLDLLVYHLRKNGSAYPAIRTAFVAVLLIFLMVLGGNQFILKPVEVVRDQLPSIVLLGQDETIPVFAEQTYYRSFFIKAGQKVATYQKNLDQEGPSYLEEVEYGRYEAYSEQQARYILWALMLEQKQLYETIAAGRFPIPENYVAEHTFAEIKDAFSPIDATAWQVDEGYRINPNYYIFRKGNMIVAYQFYNQEIKDQTKQEEMLIDLQQL